MTPTEIQSIITSKMQEQNISRYRLAKMIGRSETAVGKILKPGWGTQIETLNVVCDALGVSVTVK